jgi:hypothetical protein
MSARNKTFPYGLCFHYSNQRRGTEHVFVNINGLSGLQAAGSANLVARGLVLYDPVSQKPVVWAHRVRVLP